MSGSGGGISKPAVERRKGGLYLPHQSIDFAVHTIRPWLVRIEQAMNRSLFSDQEKGRYYVQFNIDGLMRGDYKSRMEGYAIGRQNGWLSANDIRALENMNPISEEEGGNTYLINGNMIPIGIAGLNIAMAAAASASEIQEEPSAGSTSDTGQENTQEQPEESQEEPTADKPKRKRTTRRKKEESE